MLLSPEPFRLGRTSCSNPSFQGYSLAHQYTYEVKHVTPTDFAELPRQRLARVRHVVDVCRQLVFALRDCETLQWYVRNRPIRGGFYNMLQCM